MLEPFVFDVVDRPVVAARINKSKWDGLVDALVATVESGQAVRLSPVPANVKSFRAAISMRLRRRHHNVTVRAQMAGGSLVVWAEKREGNNKSTPEVARGGKGRAR